MTDKEININGVDVSKCRYLDNYITLCNIEKDSIGDTYTACIDCPDCYYKQLQREKQKNKELERKLQYIHNILKNKYNYGSFTELLPQYILKQVFNDSINDMFEGEHTTDVVNKVDKIIKYEQTLKEIESIARLTCDNFKNMGCYHPCDDCNVEKVLDIIKGVIDND